MDITKNVTTGRNQIDKLITNIERMIAKNYINARNEQIKTISAFYANTTKDDRLTKLEQSVGKRTMSEFSQEAVDAEYKSVKLQERSSKTSTNSYYYMAFIGAWLGQEYISLPPYIKDVLVYGDMDRYDTIKKNYMDHPEYKKWGSAGFNNRDSVINKFLSKNGLEMKKRYSKQYAARYSGQIIQKVRNAILTGQTSQQTAKLIKDTYNTSYSDALRTVRTESHRIIGGAEYANFEQFPEGKRFIISTLDNRTRRQSAAMDGQREDRNNLFHYPNGATAHYPGNSGVAAYDINDRETVGYDVGQDKPDQRKARNPITNKSELVNFQSVREWYRANGLRKNKYGELIV